MNVDKVHRECYLARHQVLVIVICSKTVVGVQKCVFYHATGDYIWDFCFPFAACTFKHTQAS
jgi:hypothetical protein